MILIDGRGFLARFGSSPRRKWNLNTDGQGSLSKLKEHKEC